MGYHLEVHNKEKYIRVEVYDELTEEDINVALKEIEIIHREKEINHILCDQHKLKVPPPNMIIFETAKRFASKDYRGMKLAIVRDIIPSQHFFENVANNRAGFVKVFDDENKAKDWLRSN